MGWEDLTSFFLQILTSLSITSYFISSLPGFRLIQPGRTHRGSGDSGFFVNLAAILLTRGGAPESGFSFVTHTPAQPQSVQILLSVVLVYVYEIYRRFRVKLFTVAQVDPPERCLEDLHHPWPGLAGWLLLFLLLLQHTRTHTHTRTQIQKTSQEEPPLHNSNSTNETEPMSLNRDDVTLERD